MVENHRQTDNAAAGAPSDEGDAREMKRSMEAELIEMEKYKWNLGVQLKHDPLQDRSLNDIYCEWISKYADDFRKRWEKKKPGGRR